MRTNDLVRTIPAEVPTLRELRRKRGYSLEAVELLSGTDGDDGVDPSTQSRLERGLTEPTRRTVVKLARAYRTSVKTMVEIIRQSAKTAVAEEVTTE